MVTQANIVVGLGAATLKIGAYGAAEGACDDVGATDGGVSLEVPREYYEKMCDQAVGVLDLVKTSEKCTVKLNLAEATLTLLSRALDYDPSAAVSSSVLYAGGNADVNYLTLFLTVTAPSGGVRVYHFWKAVCTGAGGHSYKKDDKTMIEVEFTIIQDTSQTADQQLFTVTDTGSDTTAPTIAMTTPADGGTVTKDAKGTVLLTITETNAMDENSIVYGNGDGGTIQIINVTTPGSEALVAGSIAYDSSAKTVTFTPDANWTASDKLIVVVTTGLKDVNGNHLANTFIGSFSVTA